MTSYAKPNVPFIIQMVFLKNYSFSKDFNKKNNSEFQKNLPENNFNFSKKKYKLGQKIIYLEIADNPEKHARGLMFRESLAENEGMLFVFESEEPRSFWMKNTFVDLSIGYFNKNQELLEFIEMKAVKSLIQKDLPQYQSHSPAQFALEMKSGWFKKNHIKLGQKLSLVK
jgi:hypothetical protein